MSWSNIPTDRRHEIERLLTPKQLAILQDRLNNHPWTLIARTYHISEATARGRYRRALDRIANHDHRRRTST